MSSSGARILTAFRNVMDYTGADPTGAADSSAAVAAALADLPSTGGCLVFPSGSTFRVDIPTAYTDGSESGAALVYLANKSDVLLLGLGTGTKIYCTTAVADELFRAQTCPRLRVENIQFRVQGSAQVTHAFHDTTSSPGSAHEHIVSGVRAVCSTAPTLCFDANAVAGSSQIVSPSAAFGPSHVGGKIAWWQNAGAGVASITAVATLTGTLASDITAAATSIPLTAPIAGAPTGRYILLNGAEMMLVTGGGQTSTLTVTRGWGLTTAAAALAGATFTTYSASIDQPIANDFSSTQEAISFVPAGAPFMLNGIAIGADHAGHSDLDLAGVSLDNCAVFNSLVAAFAAGNGSSGNILNVRAAGCQAGNALYGVHNNGTMIQWDGRGGPDNAGYAFKTSSPSSEPLRIKFGRIEHVGRIYDANGLGTSGAPVTLESLNAATFYALDGVPIRHVWSAALTFNGVDTPTSVAHAGTPVYSIGGGSSSAPCVVTVINSGVGGSSDPFGSVSTSTVVLHEFGSHQAGTNLRASRGTTLGAHVRSWGPTPTVAAGAGAGASPPGPTLSTATDTRGLVNMGTGTAPASGVLATVTFANAYSAVPVVVLAALNAATAALGLYVSGVSANGFSISCANAPAASQAVGTFIVSFHAIG